MSIRNWLENGWRGDLIAAAAGVSLPFAFAPFAFFPLAIVAPALLFAVWLDAAPKRAFRRGFLFGLGMFGVGVSWVYVAIHDYGYTGAPIATLLTALFVAVLALYPALLGYTAARLRDRFRSGPAVQLVLLLPALWVLFEWFRGWFLTGFPWLNLGYSQIDSSLSGFAPIAGVYGVSWLCALTAGLLVYLLQGRRAMVGSFALAVPLWFGAGALTLAEWTRPAGAPLRVDIVQGNLPQITKWDPEQIQKRLDLYASQTLARLGKSDLVVWPENAITVFYHQAEEHYFNPLAERARRAGTDVVLGLPVMERGTGRYFSSMVALGSNQGFYHKRHLVPFGEFVPLEGVLRGLINFFDLPMSSFSRGPAEQPPLQVAGQRAAISICYEDAFGEELIGRVRGSTLMINGSNNAWYGDSLAPHQHLQIARMRALETGRPLVRATTNGISALVDGRGELVARSPQFETHVLSGTIQPTEGLTPYVRWGNIPIVVLAFGLVAAAGLSGWRQRG